MTSPLPPVPESAYSLDAVPLAIRRDRSVDKLLLSWSILMIAWPTYEIASVHEWMAVLGLVVIGRCVAIYFGTSAVWALIRQARSGAAVLPLSHGD